MSEPRIWKKGELVRITYGDRTVDGAIILASTNGKSLALVFDAMLGGYAGTMPILRDDEGLFRDLMTGAEVTLADRPREETP